VSLYTAPVNNRGGNDHVHELSRASANPHRTTAHLQVSPLISAMGSLAGVGVERGATIAITEVLAMVPAMDQRIAQRVGMGALVLVWECSERQSPPHPRWPRIEHRRTKL